MKRLVVTGCGRSGTHYIDNLLNVAGIMSTHETVFTAQGINNNLFPDMIAEASWCAAPILHTLSSDFIIVHLLRHPLHVARSFRNMMFFGSKNATHVKWVRKYLSDSLYSSTIPELDYWLDWNAMVNKHADYHHKVENIDMQWLLSISDLMNINVKPTRDIERALARRDIHGGQSYKKYIEFDLINYERYNELRMVCQEYGYEL